ncbi:hypothetical protein pdam_00011460 [Pocillopora damicornis]|uniref:Uncharacterized protein n=1 Tax=Pocillopora damicornis TaxID=46731 RepID=A0A3M6URL8_POCDA|nr:hypothetical protein pdam_00011460 [Pocillopora damicornis]
MAEGEDCMDKRDTECGQDKANSPFRSQNDDSLDFDLYGDLSVDLNQEMTYPENKKLKDENFVLKKNISSLYLTAREEITRKDAQIKALQDKEVRSRKLLAQSHAQ